MVTECKDTYSFDFTISNACLQFSWQIGMKYCLSFYTQTSDSRIKTYHYSHRICKETSCHITCNYCCFFYITNHVMCFLNREWRKSLSVSLKTTTLIWPGRSSLSSSNLTLVGYFCYCISLCIFVNHCSNYPDFKSFGLFIYCIFLLIREILTRSKWLCHFGKINCSQTVKNGAVSSLYYGHFF